MLLIPTLWLTLRELQCTTTHVHCTECMTPHTINSYWKTVMSYKLLILHSLHGHIVRVPIPTSAKRYHHNNHYSLELNYHDKGEQRPTKSNLICFQRISLTDYGRSREKKCNVGWWHQMVSIIKIWALFTKSCSQDLPISVLSRYSILTSAPIKPNSRGWKNSQTTAIASAIGAWKNSLL